MPLQDVISLGKPKSASRGRHFHDHSWRSSLWYQFTDSSTRNCGIADFGKQTKCRPESGAFIQSQHESFQWNIFPRYLSKLRYLAPHLTKCKIRRENCCDMPAIRSWNFTSSQRKQLIYMHEICPNMSDPSSSLRLFLRWPLSV